MFGWKTKTDGIAKRSVETTGAYDGCLSVQTHGLLAGTCVASNLGWRPIEGLTVGDSVLTFDHGMQEITEIRRKTFWLDAPDAAPASWPVIVPVGALENRTELTLLPDQGVMVESETAGETFGDPFVMVPAYALEGVRGIHRMAPMQRVELIAITFARDEVIYVEGGALVHCPKDTMALEAFLDADAATYGVLSPRDAAFVAECLTFEDQLSAMPVMASGQAAVRC